MRTQTTFPAKQPERKESLTASYVTRRSVISLLGILGAARYCNVFASPTLPTSYQPYFANVMRALDALAKLGAPIAPQHADLIATLARTNDAASFQKAEAILNSYTLAQLTLETDGSLSIGSGGASPILIEQGWSVFLVRVENATGKAVSLSFPELPRPMAQVATLIGGVAQRPHLMAANMAPLVERTWLAAEMFGAIPTTVGAATLPLIQLSGFPREYHILQLFSRDRGTKEADLHVRKPNAENLLYRGASKKFRFRSVPSKVVSLSVRDADGTGCVASLTIKDSHGRVYPLQAMRLAPDMFFHQHIYRADGETVRLPDGEYSVQSWRGPEYLKGTQTIRIDESRDKMEIKLKRWIDPGRWGWYSGDVHIHAAGCAHYQIPTQGVTPETMIRHVRGEGLSIGQVLTWGPSWYYQKQFFSGKADSPNAGLEHPDLQVANNSVWKPHATPKDHESLLRYDVEVSGFPSSLNGHLMLLRLQEQDYPGTKLIEDWPSWSLPILMWARAQGAVVGYAHCGYGMVVESKELPNYEIPPFDSIGTNEAIVDVTHGVTDFLSGCNLFPIAELNAWYHLLNCGFRVALVGETDYPCVSDERPGYGRTYVQLQARPLDDAGYEEWVLGIQQGRVYCGDGRSHFLDFRVKDCRSGDELTVTGQQRLQVRATVAAWLDERRSSEEGLMEAIEGRWHLENARIGSSRRVLVELIVNGVAKDATEIDANGAPNTLHFDVELTRSSWVAMRILPSSHTCPIYVRVDDRPIRASRQSAKWCRSCVDKLWEVKSPLISTTERDAASEAYDHARGVYDAIARECEVS